MTTQRIPITRNAARQEQTVAIDGVRYRLQLEWSYLPEAWYLSLRTIDGTPLLTRRPLQPETLLLQGWVAPVRPPGEMIVVGASAPARTEQQAINGDSAEPTIPYEALGSTVQLIYIPVADLEAFASGAA